MAVRGVTLCIALGLVSAACSDDEPSSAPTTTTVDDITTSSTTTAPEREPSTTTTAFDPTSVEGAVEAAYLKSWDVYANAVYDLQLDEEALAEVYAESYLTTVSAELERRIDERKAALVRVDHDYTIQVIDGTTAAVVDSYQNHQVLVDVETKQPVEADPDEAVIDVVTLELSDGLWRVTLIEELQ